MRTGITLPVPSEAVSKESRNTCMYRLLFRSLSLLAPLLVTGVALSAAEIIDGWESIEPGSGALRVSISFTPDGQHGWTSGICNISHTASGGRSWMNQWKKAGADAYWFRLQPNLWGRFVFGN